MTMHFQTQADTGFVFGVCLPIPTLGCWSSFCRQLGVLVFAGWRLPHSLHSFAMTRVRGVEQNADPLLCRCEPPGAFPAVWQPPRPLFGKRSEAARAAAYQLKTFAPLAALREMILAATIPAVWQPSRCSNVV